MTSSGGTAGRPGTDEDTREKNPSQSGAAKNGAVSTANGATSGGAGDPSGTKPVPPPSANGRPPVGTPTAVGDVPAPPAAPPKSEPGESRTQPPRPPAASQQGQRGAATREVTGRDAGKAQRSRRDTTPQGKGGNPWSRPANGPSGGPGGAPGSGAGAPTGSVAPSAPANSAPAKSGPGQSSGSPTAQPVVAPNAQPPSRGPEPRPGGPVPPPSLVAKQQAQQAMAAQSASVTVAGTASSPANASLDTQASIEAVPPREPAKPKPRPVAPRRSGRVRKARLRLLRVDPWSVMKTSFLLSVALGITLFVSVAVLWSVLDAAGVFESVDGVISDMTTSDTAAGIDITQYVELSRVLGFTTLIAVADVVLLTALATLGAFLYNLSAGLLGGIELTLAEDD